MLNHVVLLKLKPDATPQEIERLDEGILKLKSIEGVIDIRCGYSSNDFYDGYSPRSNGYNYTLAVFVVDRKALEVYDKSEFHAQIKKEYIIPMLDTNADNFVLAIDYDCKL